MKKREIVTYMRGFVECYNMMIDLIEDETEPKAITYVSETSQVSQDSAKTQPSLVKEEPKPEPKPEQPKPKIQKIDRGKVCALLDAGWKVPKIAGEMHASEATIYNIQKEYREQKAKQETQA